MVASASLSNTTTAYTTSQEVSASGTYSAGGGNLTSTGAAAKQTILPLLISVILVLQVHLSQHKLL